MGDGMMSEGSQSSAGDSVPDTSKTYSSKVVGKALGHSAYWVEEAARQKLIPHLRVGRRLLFTAEQIEQMLGLFTVSEQTPEQPAPPRRRQAKGARPMRLQARIPARRRNATSP
ncbi:hypothetical protein ABH933_001299 [Nocardia sp. GP40]|uniref:hypothetical protein n=1 Tax=Nocardia sp. GP40 TaxID=3156268 RepID=UPI003D1C544E